MRSVFRAISLSCTVLTAPFFASTGRAESSAPAPRPASFRLGIGLRTAPDVDAESIALRQSLFKSSDPAPASTARTVTRRTAPAIRRGIPVRPTLPPRPMLRADPPISRRLPADALRELGVQATSFTPYDRFMTNARVVLGQSGGYPANLSVACRLIEVGRAFRYVSCDPYRPDPPAITAQRRAGDCKSKALWLYQQLHDPTALYVIGKAEKRAKTSHAWVYWYWQGRWWILDPTTRTAPIAASSVPAGRYVPYYSFGRDGTYRHNATRLFGAREVTPAVATKRSLFFPISQSSEGRSQSR